MDAQKRAKTEWEYEDMCGGKKERQVRSGQDPGSRGGGGWEPTDSGIHGRCCRKADGNKLSSRATECDSLIFEGVLEAV